MPPSQQFGYRAAVILVASIATYNALWLGLDIGVRFGLIRGLVFGLDAAAFIADIPFLSEVLFFGSSLANIFAVVLVLRRSRWTPWALGAALALAIADWILMTGNPHFDGGNFGLVVILITLFALWLLVILRARGVLR